MKVKLVTCASVAIRKNSFAPLEQFEKRLHFLDATANSLKAYRQSAANILTDNNFIIRLTSADTIKCEVA